MNAKRHSRFLTPALVVLPALLAIAAFAFVPTRAMAWHDDHDDHVTARQLLQRGDILPLRRILEIVHERVPGDVIEVELEHSHHHGWEYEVKVLTDKGRVREVKLNAGTGKVRKIEDDD